MTQATIDGKKVTLSIYEKAARLAVYEVPGHAGYIVSSGSEAHKAYNVTAACNQCNCDSRILCSHRVAAQWFKDDKAMSIQAAEETARCTWEMQNDSRFA